VRTLLFLLICFAVLIPAASAQTSEPPPIDVFGSYMHTSNFDVGQSGWLASANYDFARWLGAEGDVSGSYGHRDLGTIAVILPGVPNRINSRMHSFLLGPRATFRNPNGKVSGFGHLLFGVSHTNVSATGSSEGDTSFSWVLGAGGDYYFTPHIGGRLQLDWLRTNFFDRGDNHARVALGVVYRFGTR